MNRTRVVVADDLSPVLTTVGTLLRDSFDVVGMISDGRAALKATLELEPDLVILDISMPAMSGIEEADTLRACQTAGGLGYVIKVFMDTDLVPALNQALAGQIFTSHFSSQHDAPQGQTANPH